MAADECRFLTQAEKFRDVSRGDPKPEIHELYLLRDHYYIVGLKDIGLAGSGERRPPWYYLGRVRAPGKCAPAQDKPLGSSLSFNNSLPN